MRNIQACDWMCSIEGVNPKEAEMFGKVWCAVDENFGAVNHDMVEQTV